MRAVSCLLTAIAAGVAVVAAEVQDKTLTATVTMKTVGHTTAVHGRVADPNQGDFLFCIDQERTGAQAVNFTGDARVIYRPAPVPGMPESLAGKTPESIAPALTVVAGTGQAWVFVAKGQARLQSPGNATTIPVSIVRRTDWSPGSGPRRGTDIASCLMTAG